MDKHEIISYIEIGRAKSVCVDRRLLEQYPGFVRDITIMKEMVLKIEFNVFEYDEGGLTIKVYYNDFDKLLSAVEQYTGIPIEHWENISKSGWYPELEREVDFTLSGIKLKHNLIDKTLALPTGGAKYEIPEGYWKDIADGKITI
jgi:hypothetical protein